MKSAAIGFESFLQGFTQAGMFGWAKLPGGAERVFEETVDLEESEFAELLGPIAELAGVDSIADTLEPSKFELSAVKPDLSGAFVVVPDENGTFHAVKLGKLTAGELRGLTFESLSAAIEARGK